MLHRGKGKLLHLLRTKLVVTILLTYSLGLLFTSHRITWIFFFKEQQLLLKQSKALVQVSSDLS